jgi:hypothetical protein
MQQSAAPVFVYVITDTEQRYCKIGISDDVYDRLTKLQTGCPFPLTIAHQFAATSRQHALAIEAAAHRALAAQNSSGEWFRVTPTRAYVTIAELMTGPVHMPSDVARADLATRAPKTSRRPRKDRHRGSVRIVCRCGHAGNVWQPKPGAILTCTNCRAYQVVPKISGA